MTLLLYIVPRAHSPFPVCIEVLGNSMLAIFVCWYYMRKILTRYSRISYMDQCISK